MQDDEAQQKLYLGYSQKLESLKASKVFSQNRKKNNEIAADARIAMNKWVMSDTRTIQEYETFFAGLMDAVDMSGAAEGWFWRSRAAEQERVTADIKEYVGGLIGEDITGKKKDSDYKKGDTRIINGKTYTYDGKVWHN